MRGGERWGLGLLCCSVPFPPFFTLFSQRNWGGPGCSVPLGSGAHNSALPRPVPSVGPLSPAVSPGAWWLGHLPEGGALPYRRGPYADLKGVGSKVLKSPNAAIPSVRRPGLFGFPGGLAKRPFPRLAPLDPLLLLHEPASIVLTVEQDLGVPSVPTMTALPGRGLAGGCSYGCQASPGPFPPTSPPCLAVVGLDTSVNPFMAKWRPLNFGSLLQSRGSQVPRLLPSHRAPPWSV
ncbi:hypothetical protein GWK47_027458 [Chionoecetes opilio]|uniref:Uncharacterized protein n=1 Tax=Chionoecetes opilio TaxID=41210 RepID=A0A8J8W9D8_CHIOP|nr:hypothetical protein GWK47_027458 [Chionoecetes opilio]